MRCLLTVFAAAVFANVASACPGQLRVAGDRLFVPIEINGEQTEALLDSGAEMSLVDTAYAQRISLVTAGSETARGTGGSQEVTFAEGTDINAAGVTLTNRIVAVLDLSDISERLVGEPVHVILGRELFDSGRFQLDIESGRFCLADEPETGSIRLPLAEHQGIMQLPVAIEGNEHVLADFDLGNGSDVLIGRTFAHEHGLLEPHRIVGTKSGGGIGGELIRELVELESLVIAGVELGQVTAAIDSTDTAADANIGVAILRNFRMTIDFPGKAIWLQPTDKAR